MYESCRGIYGYMELSSNKIVYIGQTSKSFKKRDLTHRHSQKSNVMDNKLRKHPKDYKLVQIFPIFKEVTNEELNELEKFYIIIFNTIYPNGFNLTSGGNQHTQSQYIINKKRGKNHPFYGKHHSEATKLKLKLAHLGRKLPPRSKKWCENISKSKKGSAPSETTKQKISKTLSGNYVGEKAWWYGKHHTEESKQKVSEKNKGKLLGENHPMYGKRGKEAPFYGKPHTHESKQKISNSRFGEDNPNAKYSLWNISYVKLRVDSIKRRGRDINVPCKCFVAKYGGKKLTIGHFFDFTSCELIGAMIKEECNIIKNKGDDYVWI